MLGKVREAVSDAAETLRRLFADPPAHQALPGPLRALPRTCPLPAGSLRTGLEPFEAGTRAMAGLEEAIRLAHLEGFAPRLRSEQGWAAWGAEAMVVAMAPLEAAGARGLAVPPLPRRSPVRACLESIRAPRTRGGLEPLRPPGSRRLEPAVAVEPRPGIEAMRALPVPFPAVDTQRLPKGLWMRYSLQMVRRTGENVRNLEVLGLFQVPRKGVQDLRHDARRGRILVKLGAEAAGSPRVPFILVRRRSDGALLSCYLEEA